MKLGVVLPLGRPFSQHEPERLEQAISLGYSSLWLQEWPVGVGAPGTQDHGTGHDPLIYAAHLARDFGARIEHIGIAALRLDYRVPSVTARAVVSAQHLGGKDLLLGLGARTSTPETVCKAARDWFDIRSCLYSAGQSDTFVVPPGFSSPRMYLASRNPNLWSAIEYAAEGWLTMQRDPRQLQATADLLRRRAPDIEIVLQVFFKLDSADKNALQVTERNGLQVGKRRLLQFVRHWREIGVSRLIYLPTETPSVDALRMLADAVIG